MVETLKDAPSSGSHSGSNPQNQFQNIDDLLDEYQGRESNSIVSKGGHDLRKSARVSKLLGIGEMNLEMEDLLNLDPELLKSNTGNSLLKEPKSPV